MTADGGAGTSGDLPTWGPAPGSADQDALLDLVAIAARIDGVTGIGGHVLDEMTAGIGTFTLVRDGSGVGLVAAGATGTGGTAEVVVAPDARRRGLGSRLVADAIQKFGRVWAHGDLPAARALAEKLGLARHRVLLQMRRSAARDDLGAARLPPGVRLRTFIPGHDENAVLEVNGRAFIDHPEQGALDLAGLHAEMAQPWFDPDGFFLAVDDRGTVLGFHWTKIHPGVTKHGPASHGLGEIYVLAVDPLSPVRGLGEPLALAGLDHLAERGVPGVLLYAEADNDRAVRLYDRLGFTEFGRDVVYGR